MRVGGFGIRLLAGLALAATVMVIVGAGNSQAVSKYARVEIHVRECPENTGDVFGKCHDDEVRNFDIVACNPTGHCVVKDTGGDGNVNFGPRAGANRFIVDDLDGYVGTRIHCSNNRTGAVLIDRQDADGDFVIHTTRGNTYTCDWYLLTDV